MRNAGQYIGPEDETYKNMIDNEWLFLTERPAYDTEREN